MPATVMLAADAAAMVAVIDLVLSHQLPLTDEKRTQERLAELFTQAGLNAEREARIGDHEIPDFMIGGLVIEVKLRASKMEIYRQLARYAKHEAVTSLLLVTNTAMGLPEEIEGKPARLVSLGAAWL